LSIIGSKSSAKSRQLTIWPGALFLAAASLSFGLARYDYNLSDYVVRLAYQLAACLLVPAAGFLTALLTDGLRRRIPPESTGQSVERQRRPLRPPLEKLRTLFLKARHAATAIDWRGGPLTVALPLGLSLTALYSLDKAWKTYVLPPSAAADQVTAGLLILAAFPLLVVERQMAGKEFPEAKALNRLCRLPLLVLLLLAGAAGLRWLGVGWWQAPESAAEIAIALVAAEIALRSALYLFLPLPPAENRRSHAESAIAGLIQARPPEIRAIGEAMRREFGIDLARSWALDFIRRATVPLLLGLAFCGWLLTGVTALPLDQRAVYESFGRPAGVFHPGVHLHLPWPFGMLRPVEFGVVREIPILFAAEDGTPAENSFQPTDDPAAIEGAPPAAANRLWDSSHPSEASYLVASRANQRQSFEVLNIDLRIAYRVGLSDEAAQQVVYNVASPDDMIRAAAGRMLALYFARNTLADVLGQNREKFIEGFRAELQSRLAALDAGVDILAVVVEAVHPPAAAAPSYQGVQASAIKSVVQVAYARGAAIRTKKVAMVTAITARNSAAAAAAEQLGLARRDLTLFDGDEKAYLAGGTAFLFERRLDRLVKGLKGLPLIIVDHRISPAEAPTLDLRPPPVINASFPDEQ